MTYERDTYIVQSPSAVRSVVIKDADVPVEILPSGDDSMHVIYYESEKEEYDIELEGDTLSITKRVHLMVGLFMFHREPEHVKLTVYLPTGYAGALSVTTSDGGIRIQEVTMSDVVAKTTDGSIEIDRSHIARSVTCTTTDGKITAGRLTAAEMSLKTTDGRIVLDCPRVSDRLTCRTTDGRIKGVLAGRASDYTFAVKTADGRTNIHTGGTGRTMCELRTTDGRIELSFEDAG